MMSGTFELSHWQDLARLAWEKRAALLTQTEAIRVLNGVYSGTPGLVLEWFAGHLVLFAYSAPVLEHAQTLGEFLVTLTGAQSASLKDRLAKGEEGRGQGRVLWGEAPAEIWIREGNIRFRIELDHPRNVGLFLDTRKLRSRLGDGSLKGQRVLNLFSYTCSLGLAAALGGASEVVNVDVSKRYMDWGRSNFLGNSLTEKAWIFKAMSAERYLDWALEKGQRFDQVLLDPPSFARFDGMIITFAKDYFRLASKAAQLISVGGSLHALTNFAGVHPESFSDSLSQALNTAGWRSQKLVGLGPDLDFEPPYPWRTTEEGMLLGASAKRVA